MIALDPDGNELWRVEQPRAGADGNTHGAVGLNGETAVTFGVKALEGATFDLGNGDLSASERVTYAIAKYDADGHLAWSATIGCDSVSADDLRVLDDGTVLVAGGFQKYVGLGTETRASMGDWDAFVMAIGP